MKMRLKIINFRQTDFQEIGDWPIFLKLLSVFVVWIIVFSAGYWIDVEAQFLDLSDAVEKEQVLKKEFEKKHFESAQVLDYKRQIDTMKHSFGEMLSKLPDRIDISEILQDISFTGLSIGLKLKQFKPLPEYKSEFYVALPIDITVVGTFHQLAEFASRVGHLNRIVGLDDFKLKPIPPERSTLNNDHFESSKENLELVVVAKTYRYFHQPKEKIKEEQDRLKNMFLKSGEVN